MNKYSEIKISQILSYLSFKNLKFGIIGNVILGKNIITSFIDEINFKNNIVFSSTNLKTKNKYITHYKNNYEYNSILTHLIKYIDLDICNEQHLIAFNDIFSDNNYFLQKLYLSNKISIIANNNIILFMKPFNDYIFVLYNDDENTKKAIYELYFKELIDIYQNFLEIYNELKSSTIYLCIVIQNIDTLQNIYYMKHHNITISI
jgi:hypothetical protein